MTALRKFLLPVLWLLAAASFAGALAMVYGYAPEEAKQGIIQKIFYIHMPVAINTFLACLVCFVASIGYLSQKSAWWDDLGHAAAKVSVVLCSGVLLTGMIWGKSAWGTWWTWSPRLTFSFMLWLLYVVYLLVRASIESSHRRATVSAIYGIVAFLDVPLVYLSAKLLPEYIHPPSIELAPSMKLTLLVCFVPVTLLMALLVTAQYRLNRQLRAAEAQRKAAQAEAPRIAPDKLAARRVIAGRAAGGAA